MFENAWFNPSYKFNKLQSLADPNGPIVVTVLAYDYFIANEPTSKVPVKLLISSGNAAKSPNDPGASVPLTGNSALAFSLALHGLYSGHIDLVKGKPTAVNQLYADVSVTEYAAMLNFGEFEAVAYRSKDLSKAEVLRLVARRLAVQVWLRTLSVNDLGGVGAVATVFSLSELIASNPAFDYLNLFPSFGAVFPWLDPKRFSATSALSGRELLSFYSLDGFPDTLEMQLPVVADSNFFNACYWGTSNLLQAPGNTSWQQLTKVRMPVGLNPISAFDAANVQSLSDTVLSDVQKQAYCQMIFARHSPPGLSSVSGSSIHYLFHNPDYETFFTGWLWDTNPLTQVCCIIEELATMPGYYADWATDYFKNNSVNLINSRTTLALTLPSPASISGIQSPDQTGLGGEIGDLATLAFSRILARHSFVEVRDTSVPNTSNFWGASSKGEAQTSSEFWFNQTTGEAVPDPNPTVPNGSYVFGEYAPTLVSQLFRGPWIGASNEGVLYPAPTLLQLIQSRTGYRSHFAQFAHAIAQGGGIHSACFATTTLTLTEATTPQPSVYGGLKSAVGHPAQPQSQWPKSVLNRRAACAGQPAAGANPSFAGRVAVSPSYGLAGSELAEYTSAPQIRSWAEPAFTNWALMQLVGSWGAFNVSTPVLGSSMVGHVTFPSSPNGAAQNTGGAIEMPVSYAVFARTLPRVIFECETFGCGRFGSQTAATFYSLARWPSKLEFVWICASARILLLRLVAQQLRNYFDQTIQNTLKNLPQSMWPSNIPKPTDPLSFLVDAKDGISIQTPLVQPLRDDTVRIGINFEHSRAIGVAAEFLVQANFGRYCNLHLVWVNSNSTQVYSVAGLGKPYVDPNIPYTGLLGWWTAAFSDTLLLWAQKAASFGLAWSINTNGVQISGADYGPPFATGSGLASAGLSFDVKKFVATLGGGISVNGIDKLDNLPAQLALLFGGAIARNEPIVDRWPRQYLNHVLAEDYWLSDKVFTDVGIEASPVISALSQAFALMCINFESYALGIAAKKDPQKFKLLLDFQASVQYYVTAVGMPGAVPTP